MSNLSKKDLDIFSNKILKGYDSKNPSAIFKDKIKITNEEALIIQSNVAKLRENRGEEIIGYKIGCVSKDTQKKMGFTQPAYGYLWKSELYASGVKLIKKNYTNPAMEAEFGVMLNRDIKPELASFNLGINLFTRSSLTAYLPFEWKPYPTTFSPFIMTSVFIATTLQSIFYKTDIGTFNVWTDREGFFLNINNLHFFCYKVIL